MSQSTPHEGGTPFQYRPLDLSSAEIRLLDILPGEFDDEIRCLLRHVSVNDKPDYEALSYVWGDTSVWLSALVKEISATQGATGEDCFGVAKITTNLDTALRYIRHTANVATFWIDALCINQDDVQERSAQVQRMGTIFGDAPRVRVWIGTTEQDPDDNGSVSQDVSEAFDFVRWSSSQSSGENGSEADRGLSRYCTSKFDDGTGDLEASIERGLAAALGSPWWTRRWVLQEALLPRGDVSMNLGTYETDFRAFVEIVSGLTYNRFPTEGNSEFLFRMLPFASSHLEPSQWPLAVRLQHLLSVTWALRSTDPRDKLYGLWGLLGDEINTAMASKPDYSIPLDRFYIQLARFIMEIGGNAELLELTTSNSKDLTLPSWVPTWDKPGYYRTSPPSDRAPFRAISSIRFSVCGRVLRVRAVPLGTLVSVTPSEEYIPRLGPTRQLQESLRVWEQAIKDFNTEVVQRPNGIEVAIHGLHSLVHHWTNNIHNLSLDEWSQVFAADATPSQHRELWGRVPEIWLMFESLRFLITTKGRICLLSQGNLHLEPMDEFYMVPGCELALIMRRTKDGLRILASCAVGDFTGYSKEEQLEVFHRSDFLEISIV